MKIVKTKNKEFLKDLPKAPGVYIFKNKKGEIIYVGRASSLRTRVSSYFVIRNLELRRPAEQLISDVVSVSYEKTANLLEAAILENNLIKKYWPKYNIKEKDNRSFVYLFFDMKSDFPKPLVVRARDLSKYASRGEIVGPYQSQHLLKKILLVARQLFPYSTCLPVGRPANPLPGKPCFHYQIGLCPGVCVGEISPVAYKKNVKGLISFLRADFPKTGRKRVNDLALFPEAPSVKNNFVSGRIEGYDISFFNRSDIYASMVVFDNGKPFKTGYRLFKIKTAQKGDDISALKETLERRLRHKEWPYPRLIVVDGGRAQVNILENVLKKAGFSIITLGISKAGQHSQSRASEDKLVFRADLKKSLRDLLASQKKLFQRVRNEAHRFAIKHARKTKK